MTKEWEVVYDDSEGGPIEDGDIRHSCKVDTDEDWHPTINGQLTLSVIRSKVGLMIRICVWGGDDFGMEKDYKLYRITFKNAKKEADAIPEPITVEWLKQNDFIYA